MQEELSGYEKSKGALLYRVGLSSNTDNPLALFGRSLRIKPQSSSIRMNRAIALKSGCIRGMISFPPKC